IGVLASLISAMVISRAVAGLFINRIKPGPSGLGSVGRVRTWVTKRNPNIMGKGRLWLVIGALIIVAAAAGITIRGLNFGVEFTGGRIMEFATSKAVDADAARQVVSDAGYPNAVVQSSGEDISVRTGQISADEVAKIEQALDQAFG